MPETRLAVNYEDTCAICSGRLGYEIANNKSTVACTVCHRPAPKDHPLAIELMRQLAERDQREARERARPAPPPALPGYYEDPMIKMQQMIQAQDERIAFMLEQINLMGERLATMEEKLAGLETRKRRGD